MPSRHNAQGSIRYVSEFFGGQTSNRIIVTQSKFLDFINPGDRVLADQCFQMWEIFFAKSSELLMMLPSPANGATQMTMSQVKKAIGIQLQMTALMLSVSLGESSTLRILSQ